MTLGVVRESFLRVHDVRDNARILESLKHTLQTSKKVHRLTPYIRINLLYFVPSIKMLVWNK